MSFTSSSPSPSKRMSDYALIKQEWDSKASFYTRDLDEELKLCEITSFIDPVTQSGGQSAKPM